ncbi:Ist1 domain-containing protein [Salix suchowensis]|nr:Ist1 domain-containing protein [Salix suchowensis]
MLDGILGRGFVAKCKSLIKLTKNQIEVVRRKRNATLKYLKKDMADLLANGLDINAYGRAEGLLAELNQLSCYDFVEQFCDFVLKHLSVMQKMRHCPEDCREAVSSLMFAAAGLNNLPELRDLRDVFYERYGSSLELFVNQEFVEKLSSKFVTMEKKIQLMQSIALEFSITWDSKAFQQRMSQTPESKKDQTKIHGSLHRNDDRYMPINDKGIVPNGDKQDIPLKERLQYDKHEPIRVREEIVLRRDNRDILFQGRQEATLEKHQPWKEDTPLKTVRLGSSSQRKRMESVDGASKLQDGRENSAPKRDDKDTIIHAKPDITPSYAGLWSKNNAKDSLAAHNKYGGQDNMENSARDVLKEEVHKLKPHYNNAIPPPYTKTNAKLKDTRHEASVGSSQIGSDINAAQKDPSRNNTANSWNSSEKIQQGAYLPDHEKQDVGLTRQNGHGHEKSNYYQGDGIGNPIPKPRSMRRKHSKSHSTHDDAGNSEDTGGVKRRSRSRRRDDPRKGLQILFDDEHYQNDEEERMIDKLLIHYSKKPSAYEAGKVVRRKSKSHHTHQQGTTEADKSPRHISPDGPDEISEMVSATPRSISLPHETNSSEATKVFTRAASFQPDRTGPARHVHPKLPDYDDLAARFAALKGR